MTNLFHSAIFPPAKRDDDQQALVFTDILFGFVIVELFTQFNSHPERPEVWYHLSLATALVLGSWIGFRRSRNRQKLSFQLKFFNLPLMRFLVDQVMIFFYFSSQHYAFGGSPGLPSTTSTETNTSTVSEGAGCAVSPCFAGGKSVSLVASLRTSHPSSIAAARLGARVRRSQPDRAYASRRSDCSPRRC